LSQAFVALSWSTRTPMFLQSSRLYVLRLSTSRSSWVLYTLLIRFTVVK